MDKNELLHKLMEYELRLIKNKTVLRQAGVRDVSCYNDQIATMEYAIALAAMLNEPEDKPAKAVKIPEDYWLTVSIFNMCRILENKCDKEMDAMEDMDKCDKYKYDNISKLRTECRRFLTDWAIHDAGVNND